MPATTTTTTEQIALEGPIHIAVAVLIACGLLWLITWSLRRELKVLGKRTTILFWALRATALAVAMWMLLGPSSVRMEESTTKKSVAIAVDVSPSMRTVDPIGTADDLRWFMTRAAAKTSMTAAADRSLSAVRIAEQRLRQATTALQRQQPESTALESAAGTHDALVRTRDGVRSVSDLLAQAVRSPASEEDNALTDQAARILQMLDGTEIERLARLAENFRDGHDAFAKGWRESLADLQHQLAGIRRRLSTLTQSVAERERQTAVTNSAETRKLAEKSRLTRLAGLLDSLQDDVLSPLNDTVDIEYSMFDRSLSQVDDQATPTTSLLKVSTQSSDAPSNETAVTDLSEALDQLRRDLQDRPVGAVFLLTDVSHNSPNAATPRDAAEQLSDVPVYVVPIGNTKHIRDIDLKSIFAPNVVMENDDVVIEATLQAYDCEGESCRVELLRDGEVIQHRDVALESALATRRVRFDTRIDEVGTQRFQVRVAPLDGELTNGNNFDQFEVNVTRNRIDVLLADEISRWEYRYLTQLFRRDRKVNCDELLFRPRLIATGHREKSRTFPTTTNDWDQYDVVMLGDVSTEHLPVKSQESLVDFLRERGGTLVMIAGEASMPHAYVNQPLEDILPVVAAENLKPTEGFDGYAFQVTGDGWKHHALMITDSEATTKTAWDFINRNSPMSWLSPYRVARPSARTLISAVPLASGGVTNPNHNTLLCWQPVGRGRIVYLASPESYRLRYLRGDRLHYRFWGQLLRWAVASELATGSEMVSMRTDRSDYRTEDTVQVVVRLNDDEGNPVPDASVEAVATRTDASPVTVPLDPDVNTPGRYVGRFTRLPAGIYRVEPTGDAIETLLDSAADSDVLKSAASASFTVRENVNRELLDTQCDLALAQQIADATGGQVLPPTAISEVLHLTNLEPIVAETSDSVPLWVQWKFLWIVFGCLFSEWAVRKWMGLS